MSSDSVEARSKPPKPKKSWKQITLGGLQKLGRSLQLPVAALPAAGLLMRIGQPDVFGKDGLGWDKLAAIFAGAGGGIIDNMPLLFCVGVAIGFAKKSDGSTAFAAVVAYMVFKSVLDAAFVDKVTTKAVNPGVLGGVIVGLITAKVWEKYHRIRLPDWLGFFSGRRFIPVVMSFVSVLLAVVFGYGWQPIGDGLNSFAEWLSSMGAWGSGIFGVLNRALIPFGMHMLLNTFAWYQFGSFTPEGGEEVHGDVFRFLAGDSSAGMFTTGFYPIMMFALPAACLAIAHCARPERRKATMGMMMSLALTSFVTGVTEPIEFSFVYLAPALYAIHAVLTGVSMAVTWAMGIREGFTFSAGLFDYLLNWSKATKPALLIPVGLAFAAVYYGLFRFVITKFNLKTPGRESDEEIAEMEKENFK
ncbi:PTS sugar transporter subunit IIA [Streptomyces spiroverticillatus]|uniref:PTS sugar transporter subunit IIA n=1 Tax=Streptomyces finlayi TaxID=67296 RepID=A0A919CAR0_9ACTN|nr:PTS transporter subunit EIIC [Streptomyces finlayi]GHA10226.1 PTS sugar transporter subunit IIA [Streptomyces spiroverticillatus]GHC95741.1 PTS sugar transporter subunit IIA [Streptomyces finlayi]